MRVHYWRPEPVRGDILDIASLKAAMMGCKWLIHEAG